MTVDEEGRGKLGPGVAKHLGLRCAIQEMVGSVVVGSSYSSITRRVAHVEERESPETKRQHPPEYGALETVPYDENDVPEVPMDPQVQVQQSPAGSTASTAQFDSPAFTAGM
jgi:hypothetical protein